MPTFTNNGHTSSYELHGNPRNPPLLCLMGITAPGQVWEAHVNVWKEHFYCITPDNRGVGESSAPTGDYTTEVMAQDCANLLDHLNIAQAHTIGCSMGSTIAQQLALNHPEKVNRLILMCPWARCDEYAKATFRHLLNSYTSLPADQFMEWIQLLIFDKSSWDNPEMFASFAEGQADALANENPQTLQGLAGQTAACINHSVLDQLHSITTKTLVIGGQNDTFTPPWMSQEIHDKLPHSTRHLYPKSGHAFHWENLSDFNQRVIDFLKK